MYKYAEKRFTESLLNEGKIRIGTLHDFRRIELGRGISDPKEGVKTVHHKIENFHYKGADRQQESNSIDAQSLAAFGVFNVSGNVDVEFTGCYQRKTISVPDCFILCTSESLSKSTMKEFEGTDSCLKISNKLNFYKYITQSLNAIVPVTFEGEHTVVYKSREENWNGRDWGGNPALTKEPEFSKQYEYRAIWVPLNRQPIEPVIIANKKLRPHLKEMFI